MEYPNAFSIFELLINQNPKTMFIKLGDNIINLDLIKEISQVVEWMYTKESNYKHVIEPKDYILKGGDKMTNRQAWENCDDYDFKWCFAIKYIDGSEVLVEGGSSNEAMLEAREKLAVLLNNNNPIIHTIEIPK